MAGWRGSRRLLWLGTCSVALAAAFAGAQTPQPVAKKTAAHRANEFTLAGLRPGTDKLARAVQLYRTIDPKSSTNDLQTVWKDPCRKQILAVDFDTQKKIQVIRTGSVALTGDCTALPPSPWRTGRGLAVNDPATKVVQLYGEPDSKSPSTRDGQPLELWYYAFDWAGPDVPQVMEVLCTLEKEGQPGRVVEITLAAPSL
ncbi:MAG: hypothetical protein WAM58_17545 [Candidatus Acidiferrum sp.]